MVQIGTQVMKEGRIDIVFVGADRIAANGDACNKIGTYGVALLAAAGTGAYKNVVEACKATISVVTKTKTNAKAKRVYNRMYPEYGALYESLKPNYQRVAGLVGS